MARRASCALAFHEGEGQAFVTIDRRPLHLAYRVALGLGVPDEMLIERGDRREAALSEWTSVL